MPLASKLCDNPNVSVKHNFIAIVIGLQPFWPNIRKKGETVTHPFSLKIRKATEKWFDIIL